jgi:hypothetical protein
MAFPDQSTQLSEFKDQIDQYGGQVDSQFAHSSIMREFFTINQVIGTDTLVNSRVGRTTLQKLKAGQRPEATKTNFGTVAVKIDTVILARDERAMLNEFQTHIAARMELGTDHGKEIAKFFDTAFLIMGLKSAGVSTVAGLQVGTAAPTANGAESYNGAFGAGKTYKMAAAGDEVDAAKLYAGFEAIVEKMEEEDIDVSDLVIFVRPKQYNALIKNDFLIDTRFASGNGDRADNVFKSMLGIRIVKTNRIPSSAVAGHLLGASYDVSANEAKCVGLIMHPKSLLVGETLPLQSKVWFDDTEKLWFIDSWLAFGVAPNRSDVTGAVYSA